MNLIRRAIPIWAEAGLAKRTLQADDGSMCAIGVLQYTLTGNAQGFDRTPEYTESMRALSAVAIEQFPDRAPGNNITAIVYVNNHRDTTLLDMITIAEKAAMRMEETIW